jgi:MFS family permease
LSGETGRPRHRRPHKLSMTAVAVNKGAATLLVIGFVDSIGTALYLAGGALFFTRVIGLSTGQVGIGLSAAGLLGFAAQPPLGWLADQIGPRRMLIMLNVCRAIGFVAYIAARNFAEFLIIAAFLGVGEQAVSPVYQAFAERVVGEDHRVGLMARVRVVYNAGYTVGGGLAAVAIGIGTFAAFAGMFAFNAFTFLAAAAALPWVKMIPREDSGPGEPHRPRHSKQPARRMRRMRLTALRDRPYLYVAGLNGVLSLHMSILAIAVPLWVVLHTQAPRAVVGPLLVVNTLLAVVFQVRVTRGTDTVAGCCTAMRLASGALVACCVFFALTPDVTAAWAVAGAVAAVVAMTAGELYQSAAGWALSYQLAPDRARAEYFATFNLGRSVQYIAGPTIVTLGVIDHGVAGWLALAVVFVAAGALIKPAAVAAERRLAVTVPEAVPSMR